MHTYINTWLKFNIASLVVVALMSQATWIDVGAQVATSIGDWFRVQTTSQSRRTVFTPDQVIFLQETVKAGLTGMAHVIGAKLEEIDIRFAGMDTTISQMAAKAEELSSRVENCEIRISNVENHCAEQQDRIDELKASLESLQQLVHQVSQAEGRTQHPVNRLVDPKKLIFGNLGTNADPDVARERLCKILNDIGVPQTSIRAMNCWVASSGTNMAHVVFASSDELSHIDTALRANPTFHVHSKQVWVDVSRPRTGPSMKQVIDRAQMDLEFMEKEVYMQEALEVRYVRAYRSFTVGGNTVLKLTSQRRCLWTARGRSRYSEDERSFFEQAFAS